MKKILGIIAEYNPFHNGHLHHLIHSKKITNCDLTIAIISGNFTQRGSTSLINKWSKCNMALNCGIDLVIELPILYSISSAENFADGAIKILNSLGVIDYISFGSETDDINTLNDIANILYTEPNEYKNLLNKELSLGISFPKARQIALSKYLNNFQNSLLSSPNNILGIEYLKALKKYKSNINPICIKRFEVGYNDTNCFNNIASATAIRNLINQKDFNKISTVIPKSSYSILFDEFNNGHIVENLNCFEKEILYSLRKMSLTEISNLCDISEGLEFNIKKAANSYNNITDLLNKVKSKRYTITRLQRILLYALLNVTKNDIEVSKKVTPYIRVLGFNENGKNIISKISKINPDLQIITSVKKFVDSNTNDDLNILIKKDILATNIYTLAYKKDSIANLDYTHKIISKKIGR